MLHFDYKNGRCAIENFTKGFFQTPNLHLLTITAVHQLSFTETMVTTLSVMLLATAHQVGAASDHHSVNSGLTLMRLERLRKK